MSLPDDDDFDFSHKSASIAASIAALVGVVLGLAIGPVIGCIIGFSVGGGLLGALSWMGAGLIVGPILGYAIAAATTGSRQQRQREDTQLSQKSNVDGPHEGSSSSRMNSLLRSDNTVPTMNKESVPTMSVSQTFNLRKQDALRSDSGRETHDTTMGYRS